MILDEKVAQYIKDGSKVCFCGKYGAEAFVRIRKEYNVDVPYMHVQNSEDLLNSLSDKCTKTVYILSEDMFEKYSNCYDVMVHCDPNCNVVAIGKKITSFKEKI